MSRHKRLFVADTPTTYGPVRDVPVVEVRDGHRPVDSPARLLHAQLNAGLIAPWQDAATQRSEPQYHGLIRLGILFGGVTASWGAVFFVMQLLR